MKRSTCLLKVRWRSEKLALSELLTRPDAAGPGAIRQDEARPDTSEQARRVDVDALPLIAPGAQAADAQFEQVAVSSTINDGVIAIDLRQRDGFKIVGG
jgi:hypothetical protein